jgi:flagellar hook-length control protein FliK
MIKMMSKSEMAQMNMMNGNVDLKLNSKVNNEELVNGLRTQEVSELNFANNGENLKDATRIDSLNMGEIKSQMIENNASGKVFKLESLSSTELGDTENLISKISDYIIQSKASSEPRVEMSIAHKEFGVMDIVVEKMSRSSDELNIIIRGQSELGRSVLGQNQSELMSSLAKAGVQVADFKIETSSSNSSGQFAQGEPGQGRQDGSGANRDFGSENNQRNHDSQKRKELWDVLYSREAA